MTMPRRKKGAKAQKKKEQAATPTRHGGGTPAGEVTLLRHEKPRIPAHATLIVAGN